MNSYLRQNSVYCFFCFIIFKINKQFTYHIKRLVSLVLQRAMWDRSCCNREPQMTDGSSGSASRQWIQSKLQKTAPAVSVYRCRLQAVAGRPPCRVQGQTAHTGWEKVDRTWMNGLSGIMRLDWLFSFKKFFRQASSPTGKLEGSTLVLWI